MQYDIVEHLLPLLLPGLPRRCRRSHQCSMYCLSPQVTASPGYNYSFPSAVPQSIVTSATCSGNSISKEISDTRCLSLPVSMANSCPQNAQRVMANEETSCPVATMQQEYCQSHQGLCYGRSHYCSIHCSCPQPTQRPWIALPGTRPSP